MSQNNNSLEGSHLIRPPLNMLETTEQKAAFCCYLINSTTDVAGLSAFNIDTTLFSLFIKSVTHLPESARLALALSLLGDLLVGVECRQHHSHTSAQHIQPRLTPTIKPH